ncbi:MAG: hypothetical protein GXO55_00740 [Chloroflexi bacterium]|nr:hypothetical protein [Chloroflexota bacterium]
MQNSGDVWQGIVTLFALLLLFGYLGWRRGFAREFIVFVAILIGQIIRATDLGPQLVVKINQFWALFKIAAKAGFSPPKMLELAGEIATIEPLIPPDRQEAFLFLLFLFVIFLGYFVGQFISSRPSPVGMIMGMINGYLIGALLLPVLPRELPAHLPGQTASVAQRQQAQEVMRRGLQQVGEILGVQPVYALLLLIALLLLWAAWELR